MNKIMMLAGVLVLGLFLVGCQSSTTGNAAYSQYNQPQGGGQQQYVGGGCGVAPSADYHAVDANSEAAL